MIFEVGVGHKLLCKFKENQLKAKLKSCDKQGDYKRHFRVFVDLNRLGWDFTQEVNWHGHDDL